MSKKVSFDNFIRSDSGDDDDDVNKVYETNFENKPNLNNSRDIVSSYGYTSNPNVERLEGPEYHQTKEEKKFAMNDSKYDIIRKIDDVTGQPVLMNKKEQARAMNNYYAEQALMKFYAEEEKRRKKYLAEQALAEERRLEKYLADEAKFRKTLRKKYLTEQEKKYKECKESSCSIMGGKRKRTNRTNRTNRKNKKRRTIKKS